MEHRHTSRAYATWTWNATKIGREKAVLTKALERFTHRMLAMAFCTWRETAQQQKHALQVAGVASKHFQHRCLIPAWNSWREHYLDVRHQQHVVGAALTRIRFHTLSQAWQKWRFVEQEQAREAAVLETAMVRWAHLGLAQGWSTWREAYETVLARGLLLEAVEKADFSSLNRIALAASIRDGLRHWRRKWKHDERVVSDIFKSKVIRFVNKRNGDSRGVVRTRLGTGSGAGPKEAPNRATTGGIDCTDETPAAIMGNAVRVLREVCDGLAGVFPPDSSLTEEKESLPQLPSSSDASQDLMVDYFKSKRVTRGPSTRTPLVPSQAAIMEDKKDQSLDQSLQINVPARGSTSAQEGPVCLSPPHVDTLKAAFGT